MKLNYLVEGEGKSIVFIHGLSDNLMYWESLTSNLRDDYKIIRIDLRGHGESELGHDEITVDLFTDDLYDILNELNICNVNLVGFSLGGAVALNFAVKYPQMVSSIVLMSSFAKISLHAEDVLNQFSQAIDINFEEFYDTMLPMVLCPDVIDKNKDSLEFIKDYSAQNTNISAIKKAMLAALNFDIFDKLSCINVPTLILCGKYDDVSLLSEQKEMSEHIKNSQFIVFDNLKHNLLVGDNIKKIVDILKKFYK